MENEIEKKENAEDEISLLDLFAVLIRYRKLIVIGTTIVTILTVIWLFIVPLIVSKMAVQTAKVSYTIKVKSIPTSIAGKLPNTRNPLSLASYSIQRPVYLAEKLKENNVYSESDEVIMSDYEFNAYVQDLIKQKKFQIENSPLGTEFNIVFTIPVDLIPKTESFITTIIEETNVELENFYIPLIETLEQNTEISIDKAMTLQTGTSDITSVQSLQELTTDIDDFLSNFDQFLTQRGEPFIVPEARGRVKHSFMVLFAGFFIFVFIAFIKNAIENVKADPESKKIITDAWNEGK